MEYSLIIGNKEITMTVLRVKGSQVRIEIEASKHVQAYHEEVFARIQDVIVTKNQKEIKDEESWVQKDGSSIGMMDEKNYMKIGN